MKEYLKKLIRDKNFWSCAGCAVVCFLLGFLWHPKETYTGGVFSGMFLGIGVTITALILGNILEHVKKSTKKVEDKQ